MSTKGSLSSSDTAVGLHWTKKDGDHSSTVHLVLYPFEYQCSGIFEERQIKTTHPKRDFPLCWLKLKNEVIFWLEQTGAVFAPQNI